MSSQLSSTAPVLLICCILRAYVAMAVQSTLARHVTSVIEFLAAQRTETFDCWFYHAAGANSSTRSSDVLQEIYGTLRNETSFPRLTFNSCFEWPLLEEGEFIGKLPALVVLHFEFNRRDTTLWSHFGKLLAVVPSHTKVLVLLDMTKSITFRSLVPLFYMNKMLNVVYLGANRAETLYFDFYRRRTVRVARYLPVQKLFVDLVRDLNGYGLQFATVNRSMSNVCIRGGLCGGYDVELLATMAQFLNASIVHLMGFTWCLDGDSPENAVVLNCVRDQAFRLDCEFDIFIEPIASHQYTSFYLEIPVPVDDSFLVPVGRPLNVVELFLKPFCYELWIVLLLGTIALKTVSLLIPSGFRNDVLLLPICGFERFNLNRAARREKFILLSLIVLFFFISNAYETKIVSLMTNRPRVRTIDRIQDFALTKMKIKANREKALSQLPSLEPLFLYRNGTDAPEDRLDGVSAYLTNSLIAQMLLLHDYNWDFETNRLRYKLLDESLGMTVAFYPLPRRSSFKGKFRYVQRALFEAGILAVWRVQSLSYMSVRKGKIVRDGVNPLADILKFSDLLPAWLVVLVGCALGTLALTVELLIKRFKRFRV